MQPFRCIMFATDFSENSQQAFRVACTLAVEKKTRLFVVHVLFPDEVLGGPAALVREAAQGVSASGALTVEQTSTRHMPRFTPRTNLLMWSTVSPKGRMPRPNSSAWPTRLTPI